MIKIQTILLYIISLLFLFISSSCTKQPIADFKINKEIFDPGDLVFCTNNSTNAKSVKWTLPDGTITGARNAQFPINAGMAAGVHEIKLQVFYGRDKTDETTKTFTLNPKQSTLTLWASYSTSPLSVYVDNEFWGQISSYYNNDPGCNAEGCLTKVVAPGEHAIQVTNGSNLWNNTVNVGAKSCLTVKVN
jgi:hypothetical protein